MKRVNAILLFAAVLIVVNVGYSRTIDSPYEVGNWRGFLPAAVSYTFDDDFPIFFNSWLVSDCNEVAGLDLNSDCAVNFYEFAVLATN
jgi:hypothetical protein